MRVAIIGAGISGLALAYYLQKLGVRYDLFERDQEVGGLIKSRKEGPYQLELGPPSLQMHQDLQDLLQELKLEEEIIRPAHGKQSLYVRKDGQYHRLPTSLRSLLMHPIFQGHAEPQIWQEANLPPQDIPDETIGQFFRRRFGQNVVDYLVQPWVSSMFGGDPEKLLLEKTFPQVKQLEREHGAVLAGLDLEKDLLPTSQETFTLAQGLESLPHAIASKLISLHVAHKVEMVHRSKGKYFLSIHHDVESLADAEFDAVVLALPAHAAAELLDYTSPGLAAALQNVSYAPATVVHTAYRKHAVGFPLEGLGAFHPAREKPIATAAVWRSALFPLVCPQDEVLFTSVISQDHATASLPPDELLLRVHEELKENYRISSNLPVFQHVHHWPQAFPQPDIFITDAHQLAQAMEPEALYVCANWLSGPTVEDCLRHARQLAQKIYSQRASLP